MLQSRLRIVLTLRFFGTATSVSDAADTKLASQGRMAVGDNSLTKRLHVSTVILSVQLFSLLVVMRNCNATANGCGQLQCIGENAEAIG